MTSSAKLKGRICTQPFTSVELHLNQKAFVCCPSWLTKDIGTYTKDNIFDIWNSQDAKEIRESIIDGSYRYCDHQICPYIQGDTLPKLDQISAEIQDHILNKRTELEKPPSNVMFTFDSSCNLSCPSCRSEKNSLTADSPKYKELNELSHALTDKLLKDPNSYIRINITGSGDPFASLAFRHYLEKIDGSLYPNLVFDLQTNGLLFTPLMWERMSKIHKNIGEVYVSIDAMSAQTYSFVRRGGRFDTLIENMNFITNLRKQKKLSYLQVNFVVQQKNYKEMAKFAKYFIDLGCDCIYFSQIVNWGTYEPKAFSSQCIWEKEHPEYESFLSHLEDPIFLHHRVIKGNVYPFIEQAQLNKKKKMPFIQSKCYEAVLFIKTKFINLGKKIKKRLKIKHPNKK